MRVHICNIQFFYDHYCPQLDFKKCSKKCGHGDHIWSENCYFKGGGQNFSRGVPICFSGWDNPPDPPPAHTYSTFICRSMCKVCAHCTGMCKFHKYVHIAQVCAQLNSKLEENMSIKFLRGKLI